MRLVRLGSTVLVILAAGCQSTRVFAPPSETPVTASAVPGSPSSLSPTPTLPSTPAPNLPSGVPATYAQNAQPGDVPLKELIPRTARVSGSWFAEASGSARILVAYSEGEDPFSQTHGLIEWTMFATRPFWRATFGVAYPPSAGVLGIAVQLGDAQGDGGTDALVFASTGGSGNCGIWSVVDLEASAAALDRTLCDATITFSTNPVGLTQTQAIFAPTDPHCCPSSTRIIVLTWDAATQTWRIASHRTVTATPTP